MTPVDGTPQRALAFGQVARATGQQFQPAGDAGQQTRGWENFDSGGSQFDGQRQTVQTPADLDDGVGVLHGQREIGLYGRGSLDEERDGRKIQQAARRKRRIGFRQRQGRHRKLPLAIDTKRGSAGDQGLGPRTCIQNFRNIRRGGRDLLEVIQDEQHPAEAGQVFLDHFDERTPGRFANAQALGDSGNHQLGIDEGRQIHESNSPRKTVDRIAGGLKCQPGFPGASRTGQGDQPNFRIEQKRLQCRAFRAPPDEWGSLQRQIVRPPRSGFRMEGCRYRSLSAPHPPPPPWAAATHPCAAWPG